ncbi:MAG: PilC/PilY family type IV pilus protein [bacterium]|nr:PilC/PilY family type IV pilus protein [bacterium]
MKKLSFILALFLPMFLWAADEDLFIVTTEPDVLIILDTSGSMTCDMAGNYTWGDGSSDYPGRDTNGDGYPNDSRLYIMKNALLQVVDKHKGIRFGLLTYGQYKNVNEPSRGGPGGGGWYRTSPYKPSNTQNIPWHGVDKYYNDYWPKSYPDSKYEVLRAPMGLAGDPAHIGQIKSWIDHEQKVQELRADGGTPIGGALYWARQYYTQELIPKDPAKKCRGYYVLLCSDGEETGYPNYNPNSPYTEATKLRNVTIAGVKYDIRTFVLGVAVGGGEGATCLDSIAKLGGTEHYYPATTPAQLDSALEAILSMIEEREVVFTGPEVPSVRTKYYRDIFIASLIPSEKPFWTGYLRAFRLNPDGTLPVDTLGQVLTTPIWEAGEVLKNTSIYDRNIYTEKNGSIVPFTTYYVDSVDLGVPNDSVEPLINWVRGDNGYNWKLGDIFHSWPVCVGPPSPWYSEEGYNQFKVDKGHRSKVVIAGANDGMLHAFDAGTYVAAGDSFSSGTGSEKWAFIPNNLLPRLKTLPDTHNFYVDGSPVAFEAWFPSGPYDKTKEANEWKTVLICGERDGGSYYFALNITDVYNPTFLWKFTDASLARTWSTPGIGKVKKLEGYEEWVAVIGGGLNKEAGTKGRAVYVVKVADGSLLRKFTHDDMTYSIPSEPMLVDINNDVYADYIYIGDIGGQLWKIDIRGGSDAAWTIYRVFAAQGEQPFYYPPTYALDNEGHSWLFFGGGDRDSVKRTNTFNRFYGMRDNGQTSPYTDADLVDVTVTGTPNDNGWYIKLGKNEKSVGKAIVFADTVYFVTYEPTKPEDPCEIAGLARLYKICFTTGKGESEEIGSGVPTSPQITVTEEGDFVIFVGGSEGELVAEKITTPGPFKKTIYWREEKY